MCVSSEREITDDVDSITNNFDVSRPSYQLHTRKVTMIECLFKTAEPKPIIYDAFFEIHFPFHHSQTFFSLFCYLIAL